MKKLSTGENLNEPQKLPENWGPIFGMSGMIDRIGDLSWLGNAYADQGWVEVGEETVVPPTAEEINDTVEKMLINSAWAVAEDNTAITKGERAAWMNFRQELRNIPLQPEFPTNVVWPAEPT